MSGKKIKGFIELIDRYNEEVRKVVSISSQEEYRGYRRFAATFVVSTIYDRSLQRQNGKSLSGIYQKSPCFGQWGGNPQRQYDDKKILYDP